MANSQPAPTNGALPSEYEVLSTPRLFLEHWMRSEGVSIDASGIFQDPKHRNHKALMSDAWLDYGTQLRAHKTSLKVSGGRAATGFPEKDLGHAVTSVVGKTVAEHKRALIESLKCSGENTAPIDHFTDLLIGKTDPASRAVMRHWVWSVKRKLLGLKVVHHVMPILFSSEQGTGKSEAVDRLVSPLSAYRFDVKLAELNDPRGFQALNENYIAVADEMAQAARADIEILKSTITSDKITGRPMGQNHKVVITNAVSFIGTSNKAVGEIILDTGMRRFWQIDVQSLSQEELQEVWRLRNEIDYLALWQGVDESRPIGYLAEHAQEIAKRQKELASKDIISQFIEEHRLIPVKGGPTAPVSSKDLYDRYKSWCGQNGIQYPLANNTFGRQFSSRSGIKSTQRDINGVSTNCYFVNPTALRSVTLKLVGGNV